MIKKKLINTALILSMACLLVACGGKKPSGSDDPNPTVSSSAPTNTPTASAPTATETPSPSPLPTATPTPDPSVWEYKIVQSGYYNACATWDQKGKLKKNAKFEEGKEVYYNDCDEYYDNFVDKGNVFGEAEFNVDDLVHHSGDNSLKITNRLSKSSGFAGFGLKLSKANGLDGLYKLNFDATLDVWVYYQNDFNNDIADKLTFCVYTNSPKDGTGLKLEDLTAKIDDATVKRSIQNTIIKATASKYTPIYTFKVKKNTWTRVQIPVSIKGRSELGNVDTTIAISTLGEKASANVSYYNPFYIDDIVLKIDKIYK